VQMPQDGLAHIEGLAPTGFATKYFEPPFNPRADTRQS
jgi:hypothetical protein